MRDSETVIQMPPPGSPRPQRPVLRYLLYAIGGIIAAIVLVWAVLYITKGRFLKDPVERIASRLTGRTVNVEGDFQLYFNPIDIKFLAEGLTVSNPQWARDDHLYRSRLIESSIATLPLLLGEGRFRWLKLDDAQIDRKSV